MASDVTRRLDLSVWPIYHAMSQRGLLLDPDRVWLLKDDITSKLGSSREEIKAAGADLDPDKPAQIAEWLQDAGLSGGLSRTRKTGRVKVDTKSLSRVHHPAIKPLLEYKHLRKLDTAFLPTLLEASKRTPPVLHPKWRLTSTVSGRASSENPNLMAFPSRSAIGTQVRACFVARPGYRLVSCDFRQLEPRVVASLSQDLTLLRIFRDDRDLYTETAAALFRVPPEEVHPKRHRLPAKTTTLGVLYGIGPDRLYQELIAAGCGSGDPFVPFFDQEACAGLIDQWFKVYPAVRECAKKVVADARKRGDVALTPGGRERFLPALSLPGSRWPNSKLREEAERQAFNHMVQGGAQEIMKNGMLSVWKYMPYFYPLLQIHDELVGEVETAIAVYAAEIARDMMVSYGIGVRYDTSSSVADSWGGLK